MKIKVFYKLMLSFFMGIARHAESTENSKYAVFLQCLKKGSGQEADLLHTDKHVMINTIIFDGFGQAYPKNLGNMFLTSWEKSQE